ncbi:MAG: DUF1385 domain-containing protein [Candidatus Latescibacteria bacterium]|nr:DUF1385 domain-containing protein [Candidatus Latescibacterota bacterium]
MATKENALTDLDCREARLQLTQDLPVGGQAVIEGVMMRAAGKIVTAVRTPDRGIVVREETHVPWSQRWRPLRLPVLRGAVSFFEMLIVGMRTLNFSAEMAGGEAGEGIPASGNGGWKERLAMVFTLAVSLGAGLGLFFLLPLFVAHRAGMNPDALAFNGVAGGVRLSLLLLYLWGISQWQEIRRVFEYHGAEHKSIFALEAGAELTVENARRCSRLHPRCGTSFLLIVALLAVGIFALVDGAFPLVFGHPQSLPERFATHLSVLPLISGVGFELLKFSGRRRHHPLVRLLSTPGLWLQRITTREPSDDQLEVALVALRHALGQPSPQAYSLVS